MHGNVLMTLYRYLKQTKRLYFFPKNRRQEGKHRSCLGVDTSEREENLRSKRVNMRGNIKY
jgi:hypothetical protein